jgi:Tfp pilus assembly ATPase PilU
MLKDKKIILYAPTFRGNIYQGFSMLPFDGEKLINSFDENTYLIYKLHPLLKNVCLPQHPRIIDMFQGHQDQVRSQLSMILEAIISEQLIPGKDGELIPVFEIMLVNPAIRSQIRENKIHQIENTMISNRQNGMVMMDDAIYDLYQQGKITKDIAIQYSLHPDRMKTRVQ